MVELVELFFFYYSLLCYSSWVSFFFFLFSITPIGAPLLSQHSYLVPRACVCVCVFVIERE